MKSAITRSALGAAITLTTLGAQAIDIDAGDYTALPPVSE